MGSGGDTDPPVSKKIKGSDHLSKKSSASSSNVKVLFEPLQLGGVANLDELEVKTLKFQNQKLGLRLTQRLAIEEELRGRIDQLEKRQTQDDAVINVIHRYWNQLNEDMRILLQRFDAETGDEEEKNEESEATTSFLNQLATWHKEELDEKLASRVQVSQRAVGKIIQVCIFFFPAGYKVLLPTLNFLRFLFLVLSSKKNKNVFTCHKNSCQSLKLFLWCCFSIIFRLEIVKFYSFRMIIDWPLFYFY